MGLEPEPTTFLQTCLGVGFVSSRGLDEGWQDRRMDRMDNRQMDSNGASVLNKKSSTSSLTWEEPAAVAKSVFPWGNYSEY